MSAQSGYMAVRLAPFSKIEGLVSGLRDVSRSVQ